MHTQPESRILIEFCLTHLRIAGDLRRQQLPVTLNLCRSGVCIDYRLDDSARAKNRCWSKCQNLFRCATLCLVGFCHNGAACFELVDVVFENRFRDRDQSGNVVVSSARAGLDVREMRSATGFRTKTEEEQ